MTNNELKIILSVQDKATKIINKSINTIKAKMKGFAENVKKNWMAIGASIVASFLAVKKAWEGLKLVAKIQQTEGAFKSLAKSFGVSADSIISDLRDASVGTMTTMELMEKASKAMVLGLNPEQFGKLMEISRASARATGESINFMFDSIVMGIGRQSRMILDNLGIIVKVGEANEIYAKAVNKTVCSINRCRKKTSIYERYIISRRKYY